MKILIIEDDKDIVSFLKRGLTEARHTVDSVLDGLDGEYLATTNFYDVIILDWMLPGISGIELLDNLRSNNIVTPVLMLSAKGEVQDKVEGLRVGADDYLAKPFSIEELEARLKALYRRGIAKGTNAIVIADISIDLSTKNILKGNKAINLTAKEYDLLIFLLKHKNSIISKAMIESQLWSNEEFINSNAIEATIYRLRNKLGKDLIKSYRNLGYKIEE